MAGGRGKICWKNLNFCKAPPADHKIATDPPSLFNIYMMTPHLISLLICSVQSNCYNACNILLTHKSVVVLNRRKLIDFYKSCLHGEHKCNNHAKYNSSYSCSFLLFYHVFLGLLK